MASGTTPSPAPIAFHAPPATSTRFPAMATPSTTRACCARHALKVCVFLQHAWQRWWQMFLKPCVPLFEQGSTSPATGTLPPRGWSAPAPTAPLATAVPASTGQASPALGPSPTTKGVATAPPATRASTLSLATRATALGWWTPLQDSAPHAARHVQTTFTSRGTASLASSSRTGPACHAPAHAPLGSMPLGAAMAPPTSIPGSASPAAHACQVGSPVWHPHAYAYVNAPVTLFLCRPISDGLLLWQLHQGHHRLQALQCHLLQSVLCSGQPVHRAGHCRPEQVRPVPPQQRRRMHQEPVRVKAVLRRAVRPPAGLCAGHCGMQGRQVHLRRAVLRLQDSLLLCRGWPVHPSALLRDDQLGPGVCRLCQAGLQQRPVHCQQVRRNHILRHDELRRLHLPSRPVCCQQYLHGVDHRQRAVVLQMHIHVPSGTVPCRELLHLFESQVHNLPSTLRPCRD